MSRPVFTGTAEQHTKGKTWMGRTIKLMVKMTKKRVAIQCVYKRVIKKLGAILSEDNFVWKWKRKLFKAV